MSSAVCSASGQAYLEKFQAYQQWSQNLPNSPDPEFLAFIDSKTPLAQKLREKWLYQLAKNKDWSTYSQHYQDSDDTSLQCYAQIAQYNMGLHQKALNATKSLWLVGKSQPAACDELFDLLLKNDGLDENLITKRLILALEQRNLSLAKYLLKQYKIPRLQDVQTLTNIYLNPTRITQLETDELHDDFYLYGLKRMVSINMNQAIQYWHHVKTKKLLSDKQQQQFLAHLALYKAMRHHPDAPHWFTKVKPAFYTDVLLDWQIRFALKNQEWRKVVKLIAHLHDEENPSLQYWLARAYEAQGQKEKSAELYERLAKTRNYYGFLASLRIKKAFSFENEHPTRDMQLLQPYQPITDQIKELLATNQTLQASRLLNDFAMELPKDDKSALAWWLSHELQWHGKSIYLSNNDELNNQLALRFPLPYRNTVILNAKKYQIPAVFIYAIIRQESTFRDDVVSSAGAHGLMQVMPATAKMVAKQESIPYSDKNQLFSASKNITIGAAYLQQLAKRFNNHPVLMAAAYNAGPKQAFNWMKNNPSTQIDIWIETLPWHETRNYLKNVIAFYAVYQYRLHKKPDLSEFIKPF